MNEEIKVTATDIMDQVKADQMAKLLNYMQDETKIDWQSEFNKRYFALKNYEQAHLIGVLEGKHPDPYNEDYINGLKSRIVDLRHFYQANVLEINKQMLQCYGKSLIMSGGDIFPSMLYNALADPNKVM